LTPTIEYLHHRALREAAGKQEAVEFFFSFERGETLFGSDGLEGALFFLHGDLRDLKFVQRFLLKGFGDNVSRYSPFHQPVAQHFESLRFAAHRIFKVELGKSGIVEVLKFLEPYNDTFNIFRRAELFAFQFFPDLRD